VYLTQFLHRALQQSPDSPMTICGDRVRTTRDVADRVARLSGGLQELGVSEGDRVAVLTLNSDRNHEIFLACWWAGAVVNPVNIRWSGREIADSLRDAGAVVLLVDDDFLDLVPAFREQCADLRAVVHCGSGVAAQGMTDYEELIAASEPAPDKRTGGGAMGALLYTGGTTGVSKGVMVSHRNLLTAALGTQAACQSVFPGGVNLVVSPMFHIAGLVAWATQNLLGGTQVFLPTFSPRAVLEAIQRHRVTTVGAVPVMLQMLVAHPDVESYDLSSVKSVRYGASPISPTLLQRAMTVFRNSGFAQGYGMTETAHITVLGRDDHAAGSEVLRSAGRALPHCELRVVDVDDREVSVGVLGEIVTRGDHVMLGYWNRPEETAAVLRNGWMHTGDIGYVDRHGYLFVVDRIKDMIITGGENVYSTEVENALAAHPAVEACSVIGVPDTRWGERVHSVVVLREGARTDADELRAHVRGLIAGYKVPRTVEFLDALPVSAAGKVLKRDLRAAACRADT